MRLRFGALASVCALAAIGGGAEAAIVKTYSDRAAFIAETLAVDADGGAPGLNGSGPGFGPLSFNQSAFANPTDLIDGVETFYAFETFNVSLSTPTTALGFDFFDLLAADHPGYCEFPPNCRTTSFAITLRLGGASGSIVATTVIDAPPGAIVTDTLNTSGTPTVTARHAFIGWATDSAFDHIRFAESDPNDNDDEYFGAFLLGDASNIPAIPNGPLVGVFAAGCLALRRIARI